MTELETRTLARASILLLVAAGARWGWEARRPVPMLPVDSSGVLPRLIAAGDSARLDVARRSRPLAAGERIDPNRAPEAELDRLPGVGPAVARRLVESREREGPFRRAEDLARVRGVGPATAARLAPRLDLDDVPVALPRSERTSPAGGARAAGGRPGPLSPPYASPYPGAGEAAAAGGDRASPTRVDRGPVAVDLNRATAEELERLPGVGPALAARIVELRARRGRFGSVDELLEVRGIGPATLERLRTRVRIR